MSIVRFKQVVFYFFLLILVSCSKETENYVSDSPSDYFNLQPGKYAIYDLDSTVFVNFGQYDTVIHYEAKDLVDAEIQDNNQRRGWRIIRYLRKPGESDDAWVPSGTYMIIPTANTIELVENNFRYLKLITPVKEGVTWKANSYLPSKPFASIYAFSVDEDIQYWPSTYENVGMPATVNGLDFDSTLTIRQVEDSVNVPVTIPDSYAYQILWNEQYAKGVGMISRNIKMWEYQPPTMGQPGFRTGFEVSMRIKSYN